MDEKNVTPVADEAQAEEVQPVEVKEEAKKEEKKEEKKATDAKSSGEPKEVVVPAKFKDLIEKIETMSVLELHELVKVFEEKFDVSAQATVVAGNGAAAPAAEEKDSFTVVLSAIGDNKIGVIKAVKEALGLGLKEAKDLVESAPANLKEGAKKEEADALKKAIETAGGKIELK